MGGAWIFGDLERTDCDFRGEPGASFAVAQRAGARGTADRSFVSSGSECLESDVTSGRTRADSQKWLSHFYAEILAFLAALVSASLFLVLLRGVGRAGALGVAAMAGRQADRFRSLAYRRASGDLAGAICHARPQ